MEKVGEPFHKLSVRNGAAVELTTELDFERSDRRQKAKEYRKEHKLQVLIGSTSESVAAE